MRTFWLPAVSLMLREIIRFYRQRSRLWSALLSPLFLWAIIGGGMNRWFNGPAFAPRYGYVEYFYLGSLFMVLLFTSIFSTISIIEDRREGFLQAVLVSPISRFAIVVGRVGGAASLSLFQGLIFLLIAPWVGLHVTWISVAALAAGIFLVSASLGALGFAMAWRFNSIQGFHAVMNLFLMPMWVLSGAVFPNPGPDTWIGWVMTINPATYGMALLRHAFYIGRGSDLMGIPGAGLSFGVMAISTTILLFFGTRAVRRRPVIL